MSRLFTLCLIPMALIGAGIAVAVMWALFMRGYRIGIDIFERASVWLKLERWLPRNKNPKP